MTILHPSSHDEPQAHHAGGSGPSAPAAPLSPVDEHKQVSAKEATTQKSDPKTVFLGDGMAYANLYTVPNSQAWNICNPGLLTKAWDPANGDLPTDGGALRYPDIDTGANALHTFVGKILSSPPSTASAHSAGSTPAPPNPLPFTPDMTIQSFATVYAPTRAENWTKMFNAYTGTTPDTKLSEVTA